MSGTDTTGDALEQPFAPANGGSRLTRRGALERFLAHPKVAHWLERYPPKPQTEATFDTTSGSGRSRCGRALPARSRRARCEDASGQVLEAWTGPQVAWSMARGRVGSFGGKVLNAWWTWIPLSIVFFLGLVDRRRLLSWHTADLLALVSFGFSLWAFNVGHVFLSASLGALPLGYLLLRTSWIGFRGRGFNPALSWPVWLLAAVAVFLGGLRVGLNLESPHGVIDVGFAGVIGGDRILDGESPYGHMPVENTTRSCGPADSAGEVRDWIQANGRCESANPRGDTYGPTAYIVYVPFVLTLLWSGKWDSLPAAHATAIAFDLLVVLGLFLVGRRFGGQSPRGGARVRLAVVPVHRVRVELELERRDHARVPRLGILALHLAGRARRGGRALGVDEVRHAPAGAALAHLSERAAPAHSAPVRRRLRRGDPRRLLDPPPRAEPDRGRADVLPPHDRLPARARLPVLALGLGSVPRRGDSRPLGACSSSSRWRSLALAGVVAVIPRRKGPLELAALSAAVLVGFELTLTHWSYLYIPWFLPFVLLALLLPRASAHP